MLHVFPEIVNMSGTLLMTLVFVYLYLLYCERYMGIWLLSWSLYLIRTILFDCGMFEWINSAGGFTLYQLMSNGSALLFTYGTLYFVGQKMNNWWIYSAVGTSVMSGIFTLMDWSFFYKLTPTVWFCAIIYMWGGIVFIRRLSLPGIGKLITGYTCILWGFHTLNKPFFLQIPWITPWCYLIGDILRLLIATGTLLVYLEKTRFDLAKRERQYRALTENVADAIYHFTLRPKAEFEYVSPAILAITGYSPEEFYSNPKLLGALVHYDDRSMFRSFIKSSSEYSAVPIVVRLIRRDGNFIWVENKAVPVHNENGQLIALEGIIRDITERKRLEQVAARDEKINTVGKMAIGFADEIRNPLTTVYGYMQIMLQQKNLFKYKPKLALMMKELERTSSIISEYLLLANCKRADRSVCSLNDIIKKQYHLLEIEAKKSNVRIALRLKNIPKLYLDENEIRHMLLHLIKNGMEAMAKGGSLIISTNLEDGRVILSVKDYGIGIPPYILESLGTPFLTTKENAAGLGLTMCYQIANRHNADISIKTGKLGTTFIVYFPLVLAA